MKPDLCTPQALIQSRARRIRRVARLEGADEPAGCLEPWNPNRASPQTIGPTHEAQVVRLLGPTRSSPPSLREPDGGREPERTQRHLPHDGEQGGASGADAVMSAPLGPGGPPISFRPHPPRPPMLPATV